MKNISTSPTRLMLLAVAVAMGFCLSATAQPTVEVEGQEMDSRTRRAWSGNYRIFAGQCSAFEDDFALIHGFDRRKPSSRGVTVRQANDELTVTWRETRGGVRQTYRREPDDAEAEAYATALFSLNLGDYGHIHSAEVVAVLGPNEMLVKKLWLIDREAVREDYQRDQQRARAAGNNNVRDALEERYKYRLELIELQEEDEFEATFRVVGYATRGLLEGERWDGPENEGFQVGVIKAEYPDPDEDNGGRRRRSNDDPRLVLSEMTQLMRRPLDEAGFVRLLEARGMTIVQFVQTLRELRDENREEADAMMLNLLMPPEPEEPEDDD